MADLYWDESDPYLSLMVDSMGSLVPPTRLHPVRGDPFGLRSEQAVQVALQIAASGMHTCAPIDCTLASLPP